MASINRRERRFSLQKEKFHGESKNTHLTVVKTSPLSFSKYKRQRQLIKLNNGSVKIIEHNILVN